jgi:hypothetical protein
VLMLISYVPVSFYTDHNCSKYAKAARLNQCAQFKSGHKINSFSWDCKN